MPAIITSANSVLNSILDAFVAQIQTLSLTINGTVIPVTKRKLPKKDEQLQPAVQIIVCAMERADNLGWMCFGTLKMAYYVEIVILSPNNNDNLTNLPLYSQWRVQIRSLFDRPPLPGVSAVYDLDIIDSKFLRRGNLSPLYDYQSINCRVSATEQP